MNQQEEREEHRKQQRALKPSRPSSARPWTRPTKSKSSARPFSARSRISSKIGVFDAYSTQKSCPTLHTETRPSPRLAQKDTILNKPPQKDTILNKEPHSYVEDENAQSPPEDDTQSNTVTCTPPISDNLIDKKLLDGSSKVIDEKLLDGLSKVIDKKFLDGSSKVTPLKQLFSPAQR